MPYKTRLEQEIHNRLYDKLQTFRFTRVTESAKASDLLQGIIEEIAELIKELKDKPDGLK